MVCEELAVQIQSLHMALHNTPTGAVQLLIFLPAAAVADPTRVDRTVGASKIITNIVTPC